MRLILLFVLGAFLVGCRAHSTRTVGQFDFLKVDMPLTVVSNRVGMPDLPYHGQMRWRYSLADGSEMTIAAKTEGDPYTWQTYRVMWFGQSRDGKWIWIQPPDILK